MPVPPVLPLSPSGSAPGEEFGGAEDANREFQKDEIRPDERRAHLNVQNVIWLSPDGSGLSLAFRLKQEGHDVTVWVKDKPSSVQWSGILRHADDLSDALSLVRPNSLLVFDGTGGGRTADRFRTRETVRVVGSSRLADRLELDRTYGLNIMRQAGIAVPETTEFSDFPSAIEFVRKNRKRYVFKPVKGNVTTASTIAADTPEMMMDMLDFYHHQGDGGDVRFILQEFVDGVEISTEGWWDGRKWLLPFNHTMEEKRLTTGNHGPNMGCMGNVVWNCEADHIIEDTLIKLTPLLVNNYVGPIDVNCIVRDRAWGLEFTPRFGYDAIFAWSELLDAPLGEFLTFLAEGKYKRFPTRPDEYGISVRMLYDRDPKTQKFAMGLPIHGVDRDLLSHVWFGDMLTDADGKPRTAGVDGGVMAVSARASSVEEAQALVYQRMAMIKVPSAYYRDDIGARVKRDMKEISGWLEPVDAARFPMSLSQ